MHGFHTVTLAVTDNAARLTCLAPSLSVVLQYPSRIEERMTCMCTHGSGLSPLIRANNLCSCGSSRFALIDAAYLAKNQHSGP